MSHNGVIETASGDLLRAGWGVDFNDAAFDPGTQSIRTDVPFPGHLKGGGNANMHRWNGAAWVEVPNVTVPKAPIGSVFSVYDATGGQTVGITPVAVSYDTVTVNMDPDVYVPGVDELTINLDGTYQFSFEVTCDATSGTRSNSRSWLEKDSGGGYAEVAGTRAYGYHRNTVTGKDTGSASLPVSVTAGDKFRVMVVQDSGGGLVTVANASRWTVERVRN